MARIPVYSPVLGDEEARAVSRAVAEGRISSAGGLVAEFEQAVAQSCEMPHAVAVSSGTAALELAVASMEIGPGDEVVLPAFSIISCVRAVVLAGATPVLVDVDPRTWALDPEHVAHRMTSRTRAVLGVHAFGVPYDHDALSSVTKAAGVPILEDAAQAHGARARTGGVLKPCGGLGDVSIFSFYANKAITTGEGGMLLARRSSVAHAARERANLYMGSERRFLHADLGHNYRLSSVQAALGLAQLRKLPATLATKRRIGARYRALLGEIEELELQVAREGDEPVPWMNAVVLADRVGADAAEVAQGLLRRGVETRPFFVGFHEQPALLARGFFLGERYPVTERLSRRGFYLPSGLDLDDETIERVVAALRDEISAAGNAQVAVPSELDASDRTLDVFGPTYAEAYDALYAERDTAAEVTVLERCFERFAASPVRRVLDLGCGTGRHAAELVARGFDVVGVDRSGPMLERARVRVPKASFVQDDIRRVRLDETFDAVVVLFAVLSYQTEPRAILEALSSARRHLATGGVLVADVWLGATAPGRDVPSRRSARSGGVEWSRIGYFRRNPSEQRVDVAYELTRREAGRETVAREVHSMHYFTRHELEFALLASGFTMLHLSKESDLDRAPDPNDLTALFVARAVDDTPTERRQP